MLVSQRLISFLLFLCDVKRRCCDYGESQYRKAVSNVQLMCGIVLPRMMAGSQLT